MKVVTKHGKETWVSKGRTYMIDNEAHGIVSRFNTEIRGFYNYYSIANNASALGRSFGCIMKFSIVLHVQNSSSKVEYVSEKSH